MATPPAAEGQENGALAVVGGVSQYDLSGVGTTAFVSFRGAMPLTRLFLVEGAFAYLPYGSQADVQVRHLLPEAQLQLQWPAERVRPYLGAGVGASRAVRPAEDIEDLTLSGAAGARIPVAPGWAIQTELRVRVIDPWTGSTADWGLGLTGMF